MTVEQLIDQDADKARQFWDDCQAVFSSGAGRAVLLRLCELCHPMESPLRATPELTAAQIGRQEIVRALWRRSQGSLEPQDYPPHQPSTHTATA